MKQKLSITLALVVLTVAIAVGTSLAQTVAAGPYYAIPSWDQQLPASTRFIVLSNWNNEAVLDRETGLVWQRTVGGAIATSTQYLGAVQLCAGSTTGNRKGWRLPSLQELQSLVDPTLPPSTVALPTGHPFLGVPLYFTSYWTGTSVAADLTEAYFTSLDAGAGVGADFKTTSKRFWCVRGGGPITVY
jgi:Protein of unknown function (DUF1566)